MDGKTYYRSSLVYPSFESLSPATRHSVAAANLLLQEWSGRPWPLQNVDSFCRSETFSLTFRHSLSEHYQSRNTPPRAVARTEAEKSAFASVKALLRMFIEEQDSVAAALFFKEAGYATYGAASSVRKGAVGVNKDACGSQVIFMEPSDLPAALEKLWRYIRTHHDHQPDLFAAVVVSIGLLNAHPLEDGNGRLSRVLMNTLFGCDVINYVPLHEFHASSAGGFVIRLRKAELFNEWDEIVQFYCDVIFAMADRDDLRSNGSAGK